MKNDVNLFVLVFALIGAILAGIVLVQSKLTSIIAWAVVALAASVLLIAWP